ncbi:hypothetical protein BH09BAC6_BH09BAC6_28530 [soil metagenome]
MIFYIFFLSAFDGHDHNVNSTWPIISYRSVTADTSRYAIIKLDSIADFIFDKSYKPATLSDADIVLIEKLVAKKVSEVNDEVRGTGHFKSGYIRNPEKFYKQFIAVINSKGEKEVWVNCCCTLYNRKDWKTKIFLVMDGGSCFFNLKINLSTNTVYDLMINGSG